MLLAPAAHRGRPANLGLPLYLGTGFSSLFGTGRAAGKSCGAGVVGVDNVYCMSLVVLLDAYERELSEDGGSVSELQVELVCNCSDEVVYCLVDFLGRGVGRGGAAKSVKLVELECRLLLVASPSKELARASYGGNVGEVK